MKINGITATGVRLSSIIPPPVADFSASPLTGVVPLNVSFTDLSTGGATSWQWDFTNNGSTDSTLQNPSTTYSTAGTYSVRLTASNLGGSNSVVKTAYITATPAPLAGNLTTLISGSDGTIPFLSIEQPVFITAYGDKNFLIFDFSFFNGAHTINNYVWNGTTHTVTELARANSPIGGYGVYYGSYVDPRGFIISCVSNDDSYSGAASYRLRTISSSTANQTTAISEVNYSGTVKTANTFLPIGAIVPDPSTVDGFFGVLVADSTAGQTGKHTLVKFTVNGSGIISNISFLGSRAADAPTLAFSNSSGNVAVIGRDNKIYINNANPALALGALWSIAQDGSSYVSHLTSISGLRLGAGLALDDAGNLYMGSGAADVIARIPWTGSVYDYAGIQTAAGLLNTPQRIDGPPGTNRVSENTVVANNLGNGSVGLFTIGVGGARGFYRIMT